jgi:hypothetical protein
MLSDFVTEDFWYTGKETFLKRFDCSYAEFVSEETKMQLADALASSVVFRADEQVDAFPPCSCARESGLCGRAIFHSLARILTPT